MESILVSDEGLVRKGGGICNDRREMTIFLQFLKFIFYWNIFDLQCCVVSGVQQSDSVICIFFFIFVSHIGITKY